jgi:SH3-like domain-containing protein
VARANTRVVDMVKARRKARFLELPELEQQLLASDLIDACCSDESFAVVRDFVQVRGSVDVEGFYVGSDGTETCALHAAAFHGSCRALELLCSGINESDSTQDGGLCNVNMKDSNGWTAMHFAAGANSVEAVRILAKHGADLSIEAANGYTPMQWAVRLQNEKVAEELRQLVGTEGQLGWISRQPLSAIASRFFALIPSN